MPNADVLIIGSGVAALSLAKQLCQTKNVIIITKKSKRSNNSNMAQGGIAAAVSPEDHWRNHYEDTLTAGCHYNNKAAVEYVTKMGPKEMHRLIEEGMQFDTDKQGVSLGKEGAHGQRRILHAGGDATGKHILSHLIRCVEPYVTIVEHGMVLDLIMHEGVCVGVVTRDENNVTRRYYAPHTVLATGGIGSLYSFSSNDQTITGDGLALVYRAGGELTDLEFVQFHPTLLYVGGRSGGLISEAVRGEGAVLVNEAGERFMEHVHEQKDLAPRDVVARAIYEKTQRGERVYLDISMIDNFQERFPTISALCEAHHVSLSAGRIPVVPGAHFHMGGVKTNLDGETSIPGLYAVGEVACNGVHGANRLASNSLLEGIVFGARIGEHLLTKSFESPVCPPIEGKMASTTFTFPTKDEIQRVMMKCVGIVRTEAQLMYAKRWFEGYLSSPTVLLYEKFTNEEVTLFNMLTTGWLLTNAALARKESIGSHYRSDTSVRRKQLI
ncbi:L-aspartate oxidase [Microbacteriaceae bacterium 4G12]